MATRADTPSLEPYEGDFSVWLNEQAALVRAGRWAGVDRENVAEELESLARGQFSSFVSALRLNLSHRLKFRLQPELATRSWRDAISREISNAYSLMEDNPSFRERREEAFKLAYQRALREAILDTGLPERLFPSENPFTWEEAMNSLPDID